MNHSGSRAGDMLPPIEELHFIVIGMVSINDPCPSNTERLIYFDANVQNPRVGKTGFLWENDLNGLS